LTIKPLQPLSAPPAKRLKIKAMAANGDQSLTGTLLKRAGKKKGQTITITIRRSAIMDMVTDTWNINRTTLKNK
jgi:hypothetical protein